MITKDHGTVESMSRGDSCAGAGDKALQLLHLGWKREETQTEMPWREDSLPGQQMGQFARQYDEQGQYVEMFDLSPTEKHSNRGNSNLH